MTFALSVLDLAPVSSGGTPADALHHSIELVQHCEQLGYNRYWVAEHHNMPGIASSAPAVLIAHLAPVTSSIRLGSGGVMLPNHAPLTIAEQFGMLEALHPHRIDLGIGRAPGTDPLTAQALRRGQRDLDDFPEQFSDLIRFFTNGFPEGHRYRPITAVPAQGYLPAIWLLGSSDFSAQVAAHLGLPFSFAHHFSPESTDAALRLYRSRFQPSEALANPYSMIGVSVVCADTTEKAHRLALSGGLSFVRLRQGRPGLFPTVEEAEQYPYTPVEEQLLRYRLNNSVIGNPTEVRAGLEELAERTGVDELMITTMVHSFEDRKRSYELVQAAFHE
jgi:luciferase family oxidoreductase group 1